MLGTWAAIFLTLMFFKTILNPLVPLLAIAAILLIRRGLRPAAEPAVAQTPQSLPTALAA